MPFDPMLFSLLALFVAVLWLQQRTHTQVMSDFRETQKQTDSRNQKTRDDEILRLTSTHTEIMARQETATQERVKAAYEAGLGAARTFVYRGVVTKKGFWMTKKRDVAVAAVYTEDRLLNFAGDYGDLEEIKLPPELKKAIAAVVTHGGGGLPGLTF